MKETSSQIVVSEDHNFNITDLFEKKLKENPRFEIYSRKMRGHWADVTIKKLHADIKLIAKSLIKKGYKPGDRIVVMSPTRYEWSLVDFAMWYAGIISVPVFETSSRPQVEWILEDSQAKAAFVDSTERAQLVNEAANKAGVTLEDIWQFEGSGVGKNFEQLLGKTDVTDEQLEEIRSHATMDTVATLVYTSGTTGKSKGCELTHGNFVDLAQNIPPIVPEILSTKHPKTILFLPLAHALARAIQLICLSANVTMAHGKMNTIVDDFKTFKPTWILCVPRVLEKIYANALNTAEAGGKGKIFHRGAQAAVNYSKENQDGSLTFGTKAQQFVFDKLLYQKIRKALGGECEWVVSGASALNSDLSHFFNGAGIKVIEGYGLTETTAPAAVNTPKHNKIGSVGRVVPGTSVKISEDGEVLIKGVGVFAGYWHNEHATADTFDADGWFKTGDLGNLDANGFLTITGRKKDILVTAGGKNVYPTPMEDTLKTSMIVDQAVVVGENKPFISALVTLDEEQLGPWCQSRGLPAMDVEQAIKNPRVIAEVQNAVDKANENVSRAESIRKFKIIPGPFTVESGHMTPTLKLKRMAVINDFDDIVQDMYAK